MAENPINTGVFNSLNPSATPAPAPKADAPQGNPISPAPKAAPVSPVAKPTPQAGPQKDESPKPAKSPTTPQPPTAPEVKKWKIKGKEYTAEELVKDPEAFEAVMATHGKYGSLQKKHAETTRQAQQLQQQYEQAQQLLQQAQARWAQQYQQGGQQGGQQPQADFLDPAMITHFYLPKAQQMAEAGYIEPDFVAAFPAAAAAMQFYREQIEDARDAVKVLIQHGAQSQQTNVIAQTRQAVEHRIAGLAAQGEEFSPLKDAGVRKGFIDYLRGIKAPVEHVLQNPEYLQNHWLAYNAPVIREAQRQLAESAQAEARRAATGESTAFHPTPTADSANPIFEEMLGHGLSKLASKATSPF